MQLLSFLSLQTTLLKYVHFFHMARQERKYHRIPLQ